MGDLRYLEKFVLNLYLVGRVTYILVRDTLLIFGQVSDSSVVLVTGVETNRPEVENTTGPLVS